MTFPLVARLLVHVIESEQNLVQVVIEALWVATECSRQIREPFLACSVSHRRRERGDVSDFDGFGMSAVITVRG